MDCLPVTLAPVPPFSEDAKLIDHNLSLFCITGNNRYLSLVHSILLRQTVKQTFSQADTSQLIPRFIDAITHPFCTPTHRTGLLLHLIQLWFVHLYNLSPEFLLTFSSI